MPLYQKIFIISALIVSLIVIIKNFIEIKRLKATLDLSDVICKTWFMGYVEFFNKVHYLSNLLKEKGIETIDLNKIDNNFFKDNYNAKIIIDEENNTSKIEMKRKDEN